MRKTPVVFIAALLVLSSSFVSADIIDFIKFPKNVEVSLQKNVDSYDVARSNGIVSPFTGYINSLATVMAKADHLFTFRTDLFPPPGEILVRYVNPNEKVELDEPEERRNYLGTELFMTVRAPVDEVFELLVDYEALELLVPEMKEVNVLESKANLRNVEHVKEVEIPFFGLRRKSYIMSNIFYRKNGACVVKSQLLKDEEETPSEEPAYYSDSLWYLKTGKHGVTYVYNITFTLLKWDYEKTPQLVPFVDIRKKIRTGIVQAALDGLYRKASALKYKLEDDRYVGKNFAELSKDELDQIRLLADQNLSTAAESGEIKVNWRKVFVS